MHVVIGIPVYREELTDFEKISLRQVHNIMSNWNKVFIAPKSLQIDYGKSFSEYEVIRFDDKYFQSIETYTELLLTEEFYEKFIDYTYLLIYQLDAFVFSDRLMQFCGIGMDFIGAPACGGNWKNYHVGNGGFSLRRISSCLRVVKTKNKILERLISLYHPNNWGEDDFFAFCGRSSEIDFKVPSPRIAATFSAQTDYVHGLRDIPRRGLPFGCHYWPTLNYHFWKPYIESYGYSLPDSGENGFSNTMYNDNTVRSMYLSKRYIRRINKNMSPEDIIAFLDSSKVYCLWGAGTFGEMCVAFLKSFPQKYNIYRIYDKDSDKRYLYELPVEIPHEKNIKRRKEIVLITSLKYEKEIKKFLLSIDLRENVDFYLFPKLIQNFARRCSVKRSHFENERL